MRGAMGALRVAVTCLAVAAAAVAGWYVWRAYLDDPWTRDGRVRADIVRLAPDVTGAVTEVRVVDNQPVKRNDVLFVVDRARFELALELARATEQGRASDLDQKRREQARRDKLTSAAVSEEIREQARAAVAAADAALAQAVAERKTAALNLERTEVRSPVNGYVTNLLLRAGDYVTPGSAVMAIVDAESFYVAGYFEETKLHAIRVGDRAADGLSGRPLGPRRERRARIVDRDNPSGGGSLIANVNPSFSWVRLAQRVPVRVKLDAAPAEIRLTAGMTATVVIEKSERR